MNTLNSVSKKSGAKHPSLRLPAPDQSCQSGIVKDGRGDGTERGRGPVITQSCTGDSNVGERFAVLRVMARTTSTYP